MSGSFNDLDVPPTLVSFAVTTDKIRNIVSPEFKGAGHPVVWLLPPNMVADGLPVAASLKQVYQTVNKLMKKGKVLAAYTPTYGGVAEAVLKMTLGNGLGFRFDDGCTMDELFSYAYGSFVLELTEPQQIGLPLGTTTAEAGLTWQGNTVTGEELLAAYERQAGADLRLQHRPEAGEHPHPVPRERQLEEAAHQVCQAQGPHPRLPRHELRV